jgi:hypothetical protein
VHHERAQHTGVLHGSRARPADARRSALQVVNFGKKLEALITDECAARSR